MATPPKQPAAIRNIDKEIMPMYHDYLKQNESVELFEQALEQAKSKRSDAIKAICDKYGKQQYRTPDGTVFMMVDRNGVYTFRKR